MHDPDRIAATIATARPLRLWPIGAVLAALYLIALLAFVAGRATAPDRGATVRQAEAACHQDYQP